MEGIRSRIEVWSILALTELCGKQGIASWNIFLLVSIINIDDVYITDFFLAVAFTVLDTSAQEINSQNKQEN